MLYFNKVNLDDIKIYTSEKNIPELENYLMNQIDMSHKRVSNSLKKLNNVYKTSS